MPKTKEETNAYQRELYQKNKEKIRARTKQYYAKNIEKEKARRKKYYEKNKETIALREKKYYANNPDKYRIRNWKIQGIIDGDFELLNEVFKKETHCWICWEPYNGTKRRKCLDHDWDIKDDSNPRYICCHLCNVNVVG